ncbi:hypothetical protein [Pseudoalteromonas luteoviolacea]|uniref:Uncharacterized protein n=1 Tax=Pseudoalteromonas luteoviolacea S4054 TaxID=1129367 RepID=A0A0F6A564_9GAMM|nr:hypothetical protein [Pseudoalteromonas luteoviolacea]AOT07590.1 hypothetical protein S4054249_06930 [Pseudoalteromonas luteoviolacea]AOT12506.1 hypothetical protein S40542_06930 [Pseudoalteromonas luteoviolacea]AOT17420.1 hypothetical protein S4054_06930 [Pseudoalteromonas luteoviolacea]KKE81330.1 hypothetical protein N479_22605 [Pseudoalteromonas luteoviolacea S4054]KZN70661.1 hypothetical protein N481_20825 [Pseudoalteromonas luteoviolacea S4047-1]
MHITHYAGAGESYYTRTQSVKHKQADKEPNMPSQEAPFSTRLEGKVNLTYLIKPEHVKVADKDQFAMLNQDMRPLSSKHADLADYYKQHGEQQDVVGMIKVDGQVMAYLRGDGSYAGRSGVQGLFRQAGGDVEKLKSLVSQHYPGNGKVEFFEQGEGPTNAEAFEMFNGSTYQAYSQKQIAIHKETEFNEMLAQDQAYRRKLMFDQTPQTAVFRVGGQVVGSMDEQGFADVGQKLTTMADQRGIERDQLKPLFTLDFDRSPEDFKAMLHNVFGDDVQLETFSSQQAPSRAEVRNMGL